MAITDRNLSVGTQLYAKYKGQTYRAEVVSVDLLPKGMLPKEAPADPDPRLVREIRYRVEGKDELFKSPSAAGTAVTGKACNGWTFWTVGEPPIPPEPTPKETKARAPRTRKPKASKASNGEAVEGPEIPDGTVGKHANGTFACEVCGAEFADEGQVTGHYIEVHAS